MQVQLATYNQNKIEILSRAFIHHCQNILNKLVESFKLFPSYWSQFINSVPISFHFYRYCLPHSEDVFSLNIWTLSSTDPAQCQPGPLSKRLKWKKKKKKNQFNFHHPLTPCICSGPFSGNAILSKNGGGNLVHRVLNNAFAIWDAPICHFGRE